MEKEKVQTDWESRGFSFGVFTDPPGRIWEDYVHEVDELFMVVTGEVELEMNGEVSHPKPGEEVLIPAQVTHSVRNVGQTSSCWFYGYKTSRST